MTAVLAYLAWATAPTPPPAGGSPRPTPAERTLDHQILGHQKWGQLHPLSGPKPKFFRGFNILDYFRLLEQNIVYKIGPTPPRDIGPTQPRDIGPTPPRDGPQPKFYQTYNKRAFFQTYLLHLAYYGFNEKPTNVSQTSYWLTGDLSSESCRGLL